MLRRPCAAHCFRPASLHHIRNLFPKLAAPNDVPRSLLGQVRRWIKGKDPRQYGFDFADLVEEKFDHKLRVTVGRLLAALEITRQKPLRRAYERDL